jgi:phage-related protein
MTVAFNPSINPSMPLVESVSHRVNKTPFGDGYVQRAADGLNSEVEAVELVWDHANLVERDELLAFLKARGGVEPFTCTFLTSTASFVCEGYSSSKNTANSYTVRAELEQVFE